MTKFKLLDIFKDLLEVNFCEKGFTFEGREQEAYVYFADFIDECEGTRHNNNNCMLPPSQVSFGKN